MKKSAISPMPVFFDRYINIIEEIDIIEAFDKYSPEKIFADTEELVALGDKIYAPGKWTVKDIIQHVIDNERIMAYRALRFSRNDQTTLPGYDEELLAQNTNAVNRNFQDLMDEFTVLRSSTVALFKGMNDEMILRPGTANATSISALALGFVILGHPVHHMNIIRERYFPLLSK